MLCHIIFLTFYSNIYMFYDFVIILILPCWYCFGSHNFDMTFHFTIKVSFGHVVVIKHSIIELLSSIEISVEMDSTLALLYWNPLELLSTFSFRFALVDTKMPLAIQRLLTSSSFSHLLAHQSLSNASPTFSTCFHQSWIFLSPY